MNAEQQDIFFSQLTDGELPSDEVNALLLETLDDPAGRQRLRAMLELRQATRAWRQAAPAAPVIVAQGPLRVHRRRAWRLGGLAAAAMIGGLLVLAGFWAGGFNRNSGGSPSSPVAVAPSASVSPEQMRQVASVFALHESVAGPLAWYAADDQTIKLASIGGVEASNKPVAVLLRLVPTGPGGTPKTYVFVCREKEGANIELPAEGGGGSLRVYLAPHSVNGKVNVQYVIALGDADPGQEGASLAGRRPVGLTQTSLGQLALGDRLLNVQACAWPMTEERNW